MGGHSQRCSDPAMGHPSRRSGPPEHVCGLAGYRGRVAHRAPGAAGCGGGCYSGLFHPGTRRCRCRHGQGGRSGRRKASGALANTRDAVCSSRSRGVGCGGRLCGCERAYSHYHRCRGGADRHPDVAGTQLGRCKRRMSPVRRRHRGLFRAAQK